MIRALTSALFCALLAFSSFVAGAAQSASGTIRFDIEAGDASSRLLDFSRQASMQVLFDAKTMEYVRLAAVRGEYRPFDALALMVAGTDIRYSLRKNILVLLLVTPEQRLKEDRRTTGAQLPEVRVTGSPERFGIQGFGLPMGSYDRSDLDVAGFVTAQDLIRTLPQVFGGGPTEDTMLGTEARSNFSRGVGVNLRGLGASSTMVLLNGHRLPGAGSDGLFADISNLPAAAIERIDILPDSSSTYYGSDAVAGVVNFVMRDEFKGRETEAYVAQSTRGAALGERHLSQIVGGSTSSGHGLAVFNYYSRRNLPASDRSLARSDLSAYGGSNFDSSLSNPGNIIVGSTTLAVPRGQDGRNLKPVDFLRYPNLQNVYSGADILPSQERLSAFGTWRQDLTEQLSLFADMLAGRRDVRSRGTGATSVLTIPRTNAFYATPLPLPSSAPLLMRYSFLADLGPQITTARVWDLDVATGIDLQFDNGWHASETGGYASESLYWNTSNQPNGAALGAALASTDPDTAFNAFGDGSYTNPATLEALRGSSRATVRSETKSLSFLVEGPVLSLPGGDVKMALGVDQRRQFLLATQFTDTTVTPSVTEIYRERRVRSGFAELSVPLVGKQNRIPGVESLALSLAERYEKYDDFGKAQTPRVGLSWGPLPGLALRGSYSKSFRPPGLLDLDEGSNVAAIQPLINPETGKPANVLLWLGRNQDLRQETARSWTVSVELSPEAHPDTALALTYFNTNFADRLNTPNLTSDLLTNSALKPLVTREPSDEYRAEVCARAPYHYNTYGDCRTTPILAIVDGRTRNDARAFTDGIDMFGRYEWMGARGRVTAALNGTYILRFAEARSANLPLVDEVSTQNHPVDFKFRGSLRWQVGAWDFFTAFNYLNGYRDVVSEPVRRVGTWTTVDVHVAYTLPSQTLGDTTVALGADNVLDRDPPFLNNSAAAIGFDQENGDLIGRMVSLSLRTRW